MTELLIRSSEGLPSQPFFLMDYIEGTDGVAITEASLDTIVVTVMLADTGKVLYSEEIDIGDTVFDTPQTTGHDPRWEALDDDYPAYNFGWQVPARLCPPAGETYLYRIVGTEVGVAALTWAVYHYRSALAIGAVNAPSDIINVVRGDRLSVALPVLGDITARTKLWMSVKSNSLIDDSDALLLLTEAGGLVTFDGAAATSSALGSLTVTSQSEGRVTLFLDKTITAQMRPWKQYVFDLQWQGTDILTTPRSGRLIVAADVTRATS